ncbi:hypothetical protein NIES4071_55850 [Calothrix sp. NIES-4071]|nr:hypothetical protein NIES4071_55850 [Calothrix sp. NIES-4071]BAZ59892.1 hypothetical protein NIES4105_55800 [Calothrix sp. NIES-4105]
MLGAAAIVSAIALSGCQSGPNASATTGDSTQQASNVSDTGTSTQRGDRYADLNLTDAQKSKMTQIREQSKAKILPILTLDQQEPFNAASSEGSSPMKTLKELNLNDDQKQKIRAILKEQRTSIQAILTPEQQAKMKQHRASKPQSDSN